MTYENIPSSEHDPSTGDGWEDHPVKDLDQKPKRLRIVLFALLAIALVWLIITRSLVAYLADNSPEAALKLRPGDATALVNLAESKLEILRDVQAGKSNDGTGDKPQNAQKSISKPQIAQLTEQIRAQVTKALLDEPLNARALAILGELASSDTDKAKTERLMAAAKRLSLRESGSLFWLMNESFNAHDYSKVLEHADALLRTRGSLAPYVVPYLGRLAENKQMAPELKKLLASKPTMARAIFCALAQKHKQCQYAAGSVA